MNSLHFYKIKTLFKFFIWALYVSMFFMDSATIYAQKEKFVIVLDAGHGGREPGKVGYRNIKEKDITLKIALQVGKLLEKESNIKIIYTRNKDEFVGLYERGKIANKADADLFVSIHCNAHHTQAYGAETWVLGTHANAQNFEVAKAENSVILVEDNYEAKYKGFDPNSPDSVIGLTLMQEEYLDQSIQLASIIQNGFTNGLKRKNRGVKQAGFIVLHQTYMPSVLIETGFITNKIEGPYLNSTKGQLKFAQSIYKGITTYVKQLSLNTVDTVSENVLTNNGTNHQKEIKTITKPLNVIFKVQIASGSRKLETKAYNFKGLKNVERVKVGKSYKYYIGNSSNYEEIVELQKIAKAKGYRSAFVVAFQNGTKVSVEKVLKKS